LLDGRGGVRVKGFGAEAMKKRNFLLVMALGVFALHLSCGARHDPAYVKDGRPYGVVKGSFRDRWWNYFERGGSFAEGGFWVEAVSDFQKAIAQRDRDQRSARTYGMHFVDYFPHRELGIAYYELKRYAEAQGELEKSLADEESAKAKFYLNKARKALLEQIGKELAPPKIQVSSPAEEAVTNRFKVQVEGSVEGEGYARGIEINNRPLFIELADRKLPFSREIKLQKGLNEIRIKTQDLLGRMTEKTVRVFADFEGPALNVRNLKDGQRVRERRVVLSGDVADATGITMVRINDQVLAYNKEKEVEFAFGIDLKEGENSITLAATDVAGNTTTGALRLEYVPQLAEGLQNPLRTRPKDRGGDVVLAFHGGRISDAGMGLLVAAATAKPMGSDFTLILKDLADRQTVYYETLYVDGSVTGRNPIKSVKLNGSPVLIIPGTNIYFNHFIELEVGENRLTLEVEDAKGNKGSQSVTIIREVPKVRQVGSRMSLAILPFVTKGEASAATATLSDNLTSAFLDLNRFNIVTRGDDLEAVLRELKLSKTDLVDQKTAVRVGKLVAAEGILTGTVHETRDSVEIYARLINTETSSILEAKDVYGQDKSLAQLRHLTGGLALKFKHSLPLLEGLVLKVSGKSIYADFGSVQHVKKEMKFIVFREGETIVHPVTGRVLGRDLVELGLAVVINVFEDMSVGELLAQFDPGKIRAKDLIITK
jgi:TolB-like protein